MFLLVVCCIVFFLRSVRSSSRNFFINHKSYHVFVSVSVWEINSNLASARLLARTRNQ